MRAVACTRLPWPARYSLPAWMSELTGRAVRRVRGRVGQRRRPRPADERGLDRRRPVGCSRRRPVIADPAALDRRRPAHGHDRRDADHRVARRRLLERRVRGPAPLPRAPGSRICDQQLVGLAWPCGTGPRRSRRAGRRAFRPADRSTSRASSARSIAGRSEAGSAWATRPAHACRGCGPGRRRCVGRASRTTPWWIAGVSSELRVRRQRPDREPPSSSRPHARAARRAGRCRRGSSGVREPQLHQRQQALAAGDDLGAVVRARGSASASSTLSGRVYPKAAGIMPGLPSRPGSRPRPSAPCTACRGGGCRAGSARR